VLAPAEPVSLLVEPAPAVFPRPPAGAPALCGPAPAVLSPLLSPALSPLSPALAGLPCESVEPPQAVKDWAQNSVDTSKMRDKDDMI
jgi:hypothetical protein